MYFIGKKEINFSLAPTQDSILRIAAGKLIEISIISNSSSSTNMVREKMVVKHNYVVY